MTAATQHDFHPDAEMLNAFAEQALPERERSRVLAHLAVCSRCRQILALAQQAVTVETAPAPIAAAPISASAWWRKWRIVWVPAAVAAAFTMTIVSIHLRQAEHSGVKIQVAKQAPAPNLSPASAPPQPEMAEAAPPGSPPAQSKTAAPSVREHGAGTHKETRSVLIDNPLVPEGAPALSGAEERAIANGLAAPPASANETVTVEQNQPELAIIPPVQSAAASQLAPAGAPVLYKTPLPATSLGQQQPKAKRQAKLTEQQDQIESVAMQDHLIAADAALQPGAQAARSGAPASTNDSAASYNQQLEMRAGSTAAFGSFHGTPASGTRAGLPIHLPNGLAVMSFAFSARRCVAIDTEGTVFVRENYGSGWKLVKPQWTGRAVLVRTQAPSPSAPVAARGAASNGNVAAIAPSTAPLASIFEIVNDKNQSWLSTDGTNWTAK